MNRSDLYIGQEVCIREYKYAPRKKGVIKYIDNRKSSIQGSRHTPHHRVLIDGEASERTVTSKQIVSEWSAVAEDEEEAAFQRKRAEIQSQLQAERLKLARKDFDQLVDLLGLFGVEADIQNKYGITDNFIVRATNGRGLVDLLLPVLTQMIVERATGKPDLVCPDCGTSFNVRSDESESAVDKPAASVDKPLPLTNA